MASWSWVAAARRGTSHERTGLRLQDAHSCFVPLGKRSDIFVAIVSDGAGSAALGGQGASLICRAISAGARRHFLLDSALPIDAQIEAWVDTARDRIYAVAERRGVTPRDFAATLVCAISDGNESLIAHVGDGCVVLKDTALNRWHAPTWPDHGEYASTTTFVTDDPAPKLRLSRYVGPIGPLVLFSDGLERLALDFVRKQPFERFFDGVCRPLVGCSIPGRDRALSEQLKLYLDSPAINARTDDDKTLVLAIRT